MRVDTSITDETAYEEYVAQDRGLTDYDNTEAAGVETLTSGNLILVRL